MPILARSRFVLGALAIAVLALLFMNASPAHGFAYTVNTNSDSTSDDGCGSGEGLCSLREAIEFANDNPGADTIGFDQNVFTAGTSINVASDLPYADASEGITIDGGANGVLISNYPFHSTNFGLVFVSDDEVQNVTLRNITVQEFEYDGIQVCPQPQTSTCNGSANNITFQNVNSLSNTHDGVDILGYTISNINLDKVFSSYNGHIGIDLDAGPDGGLYASSITNSQTIGNSGGNIYARGELVTGLQMSDTSAYSSDHDGVLLEGHTIAATDLTRVDSEENHDSGISFQSDYTLSNITVSDSKVLDSGTGVSLVADGGSSSLIQNSTIQYNNIQGAGIRVDSENGAINGVIVQGNTVQGADGNGVTFGSVFGLGGSGNIVQGNTVTSSTNDGIHVTGGSNFHVTISRNATALNTGLGIELNTYTTGNGVNINDPGDGDDGANTFLNYPVITSADGQFVQGTACAGCLVEIFHSDNDSSGYGEGSFFENDGVTTGSGQFTISLCGDGLQSGAILTATATDAAGNTSEFSANFPTSAESEECPATPTPSPSATTATHTPSPTPTLAPGQHLQGDLTCDNQIDGFDALLALSFAAGVTQPTGNTCPAVGSGTPKFGDVDCSGTIDGHDAVAILVFAAGVTRLSQHEPCTNIGQPLS